VGSISLSMVFCAASSRCCRGSLVVSAVDAGADRGSLHAPSHIAHPFHHLSRIKLDQP
jgi:hypothetical protein